MQTLLSVLALTIMLVTLVGLLHPPFISQALLKGKPVERWKIALVGISAVLLCLVAVGAMTPRLPHG